MKTTICHLIKRNLLTALSLIALAPFAANAQTETVLHNFIGGTGYYPSGGLIADNSGNLYGTAYNGGPLAEGALFQVDRSGQYTLLHAFGGAGDGANPGGPVTRDSAGNLYGETEHGGAGDNGVIYKLDSGGHYTILHNFSEASGGIYPVGSLVRDAAGNLYGTTYEGGASIYGVVYKLAPDGQYTVLHSFTGGADGSLPESGVALDAAGNLYGTTFSGGAINAGVVYKIDPHGNETVLHSFLTGVDGYSPIGKVILDRAGNIYGTTESGGRAGYGIVFKLDPAGNETVLYTFEGPPDGAFPQSGLTFDASGNLWGVTSYGGAFDYGVIFKIDRTTYQESLFYSFSGLDGGPYIDGPLLFVNGNIYGTTYEGGSANLGVIFKVVPAQ